MSPTRRIRIASAQYPIDRIATMGAFHDKLSRWIGEAARRGAELVVFPEYGAMELAGIAGERIAADVTSSLQAVSDALTEADAVHAELAQHHRVHILAASGPTQRSDLIVNAARLITPDGYMGVQEKRIMTPFEREWGVSPGETLRVFETALGTLGIAICYDSEFPLLVRAQVEAGADIILVPSCTERVSGSHRVRTAALARALENTCAVVVSPTVGEAPWCPAVDRNAGMAGAYVPAEASLSDTGILAEGQPDVPGWVYADIDLGALRALRTQGEMRNAQDWPRQPGAQPLAGHVELVKLA